MMKNAEWLKVSISTEKFEEIRDFIEDYSLNTVCQSADCPNIGECFAKKTATFMIMGNICTRGCRYCSVPKGKPSPLDKDEPKRLAQAVEKLGLKFAVVTSVTRDDLPDGGAYHFAQVISEIKKLPGNIKVEVLIPDFLGAEESIKIVAEASPEVFGHNIETIPEFYSRIRPRASYKRSLDVLRKAKEINPSLVTKSGIMLGFGEQEEDVVKVMKDLREVDCDIMTLGQYLRPSERQVEVVEYVTPEKFKQYEKIGYSLGFKFVASSPLVRSSYRAEEAYLKAKEN